MKTFDDLKNARYEEQPIIINQHSVKVLGNNLSTIFAVRPSIEQTHKKKAKQIYI